MIEPNSLLHGDCLEVMKDIEDGSVDMILTDPPYNINYREWDVFENVDEVISEWKRILKTDGSILVFSGWSFAPYLAEKIISNNFILNDWIIYDRIKGRGAKKRLVSTREDILWFVNTDKWTFNKEEAYSTIKKKTGGLGLKNGKEYRALSNVWTDISPIVPWSKERNEHPTQKPLQLMIRCLKVFSNENDLVLDSYMGSGSTCVACVNTNRKYLGIEKEQKYYDIAVQRVEEAKELKNQEIKGLF